MAELDLEALRRTPRHRLNCALERWERSRSYWLRMPECDCDWSAILAALDCAERVEAALTAVIEQESEEDWFPEDRPIALVHLGHLHEPNPDCALCLRAALAAAPAEEGR